MTTPQLKNRLMLLVGIGALALVGVRLVLGNNRFGARLTQASPEQAESSDFGSRMIDYIKQGRYDDAVQVGLQSLQGRPSDEIVYQQIANVYLIRAQKDDLDKREQWVDKGVSYIEKALSLNSGDRDIAGVHLLMEAHGFRTAGDLSTSRRCVYYQRATKLLLNRVPLLQGDKVTLQGKDYPLAPLRDENEKNLAEVKAKAEKADCK